MILVYTGEGKGKTSAAMGQIIRALGHSLRVACAQFMKRQGVAGEQKCLESLLGTDVYVGGLGFLRDGGDFPKHREAALATLVWANNRVASGIHVLVLDEALYALAAGVLEQDELQTLLDVAGDRGVHVVLTGRGLPDWLRDQADLVTEMRPVKHPFKQGRGALAGIDY